MKNRQIFPKSRRITLAALALALGSAVYLNWTVGRSIPPEAGVIEPEAAPVAVLDPLTDADTPAGTEANIPEENANTVNKNYGEAQLVSVNKDSGAAFFDAARLARGKARDEALEALQKTLKSANLSAEEKEQLTTALGAQVNNVTMESNLETIIKAKGFADCVVGIDGKRANVTVMTENDALTAAEVAKIRDVLLGQCHGMTAQDITIVEVK